MAAFEGRFTGKDVKIAIVVTRFNEFIASKLPGGAMDDLIRNEAAKEAIDAYWVPGISEIPSMTERIVANGKYDGVTILDSVIRGSTSHYDLVCNEATKDTGQIDLTSDISIMFGMVTTEGIKQAIGCPGSETGNKDSKCAQGVLEMISLARQS